MMKEIKPVIVMTSRSTRVGNGQVEVRPIGGSNGSVLGASVILNGDNEHAISMALLNRSQAFYPAQPLFFTIELAARGKVNALSSAVFVPLMLDSAKFAVNGATDMLFRARRIWLAVWVQMYDLSLFCI